MTALNLFTTKFDQVLSHIENRANSVDHVLMDTPGQIEIFTWSASGQIITDALASALPTVVVYVVDTPRTTAPATFMSNMLYACSILYKTRLPFILAFNKTDLEDHQFAIDWMRDFELYQDALVERRKTHGEDVDGPAYMDSLMNSMSLVLDEFYKHLRVSPLSLSLSSQVSSEKESSPLTLFPEPVGGWSFGHDGGRNGRAFPSRT